MFSFISKFFGEHCFYALRHLPPCSRLIFVFLHWICLDSLFYYYSYKIGVGAEDYDFPGVQTTQWQRGQPQQVVSFVDYDGRDDDGDEEDENYDNDGDYDGADDSDDEEDENF